LIKINPEIIVGNEVPFITNTQLSSNNSNPFQNYERKNIGLTLKVKPQINEGKRTGNFAICIFILFAKKKTDARFE
jgi:type II secretory pathway component GspD/PulD (secretin)